MKKVMFVETFHQSRKKNCHRKGWGSLLLAASPYLKSLFICMKSKQQGHYYHKCKKFFLQYLRAFLKCAFPFCFLFVWFFFFFKFCNFKMCTATDLAVHQAQDHKIVYTTIYFKADSYFHAQFTPQVWRRHSCGVKSLPPRGDTHLKVLLHDTYQNLLLLQMEKQWNVTSVFHRRDELKHS